MLPIGNPPEQQDAPEDSFLLETLNDILKNGGRIPTDSILVQRMTLAGVREVYRSSSRNQTQLRRQWATIIILFVSVASSVVITTITHNEIWEAIHALQALVGGR